MTVPLPVRWVFGITLAAFIFATPFVYYRASYNHSRRLREVDPGVLYRSGLLTAGGFSEAVQRLGIKTIVSLQGDVPYPTVPKGYFDNTQVPEIELCEQLGVRFIQIAPDLIPRENASTQGVQQNDSAREPTQSASRTHPQAQRPQAIDKFLKVMDDPANYPVLVHCKAGLHRTGVIVAVYRMEYQGYSPRAAMYDTKANGFGQFSGTSADEYISQYILNYQPGQRRKIGGAGS